jgi:hypothetical protein
MVSKVLVHGHLALFLGPVLREYIMVEKCSGGKLFTMAARKQRKVQ